MLDWAKAFHEAIGIQSPRLFILLFAGAGFVMFGFVGWMIDKGYRTKLAQENTSTIHRSSAIPAAAPIAASPAPRPRSPSRHMTKDEEPAARSGAKSAPL